MKRSLIAALAAVAAFTSAASVRTASAQTTSFKIGDPVAQMAQVPPAPAPAPPPIPPRYPVDPNNLWVCGAYSQAIKVSAYDGRAKIRGTYYDRDWKLRYNYVHHVTIKQDSCADTSPVLLNDDHGWSDEITGHKTMLTPVGRPMCQPVVTPVDTAIKQSGKRRMFWRGKQQMVSVTLTVKNHLVVAFYYQDKGDCATTFGEEITRMLLKKRDTQRTFTVLTGRTRK